MWVNNIAPDLPEAASAFSSLESVFSLQGESITTSSLCAVDKVILDGIGYYIKRYRRAGEGWAELVGISKAKREWQNLMRFSQWQLPAAKVVAYGEGGFFSLPRRGVVITQEIIDSTDLAELAENNSPLLKNNRWLSSVLKQVAHSTRVMHQNGFAHNDWKWRNILVVGESNNPEVHLIDCPSGMFWWGPFFEYRRIKDLACLDKVGLSVLSSAQRLKFYFYYAKINKLTPEHKKNIRKVLAFFEGRD
jgi:serine/threonine protein kinase